MVGDSAAIDQVIVCLGGTCRRSKGHTKLLEVAQSSGAGFTIPCQDICKGPVVGIAEGGTTRWYRKVRGDTRRALEELLRGGGAPKTLRSAEVTKRRNKVRHPRRLRRVKG